MSEVVSYEPHVSSGYGTAFSIVILYCDNLTDCTQGLKTLWLFKGIKVGFSE